MYAGIYYPDGNGSAGAERCRGFFQRNPDWARPYARCADTGRPCKRNEASFSDDRKYPCSAAFRNFDVLPPFCSSKKSQTLWLVCQTHSVLLFNRTNDRCSSIHWKCKAAANAAAAGRGDAGSFIHWDRHAGQSSCSRASPARIIQTVWLAGQKDENE